MKRFLLALAIMAMTLSVGAQTKKSTVKKTTTTATTKRSTTSKSKSTASKAKSTASKTKSTASKTSTTTKKTTVTTPGKTTTTTTTTRTVSQPTSTVKEQQRETTTTYSNKSVEKASSENKGWSEVYHFLGGSFVKAKEYDNEDGDLAKISGSGFRFSTGFSHAFPVSQNIPLYIRPGIDLTFVIGSKNIYDFQNIQDELAHSKPDWKKNEDLYDLSVFTFSASINLDCGYKIPIAGGKMSIMPYVGGELKINALGKASRGGDTYDLFKDEDLEDLFMTDIEKGANRVQAGLRLGADFYAIRHLVVGLQLQLHTPYCSYKFEEDDYSGGFKITETSFGVKAGFVW